MYSSRRNMSILNHAAVEALCSATYVENYLDCTQNLSDEVQRMLSKVFELDFKTMEINTEMKRHEKSYNKACSRLDHAQHDIATKKRLLIQIQRSLIRNQEIADEKLRLVNHICEIIDNTTRQLDQDRENLDPAAQEKPVTPLNNSTVARMAAHASKASAAAQMAQDRLKHQNTDKPIKSDNRHTKAEKTKTLKVNREKVTNTTLTLPNVPEIKKSPSDSEIKSEIKVEEKQEVLCLPPQKSPIASKDHIKHVERGGGDHIVRPQKEEIIERSTEIEKPIKSDDHIREIIKSPSEQVTKQIKNEPQRKEEKQIDNDISPVKSNETNEKEDEEMDNSIDNIPIEKGKRLRRQRHPTSESVTNIKDLDIRKEEMEEPRKKKKKRRKDFKLNTSKSPVQPKSKQVSPIQETDPDEVTYCSCKQISYGDMIGCDYINCSIEWYHFNCVGLDTKPKGKWFCPVCRKGDKSNICRSDLKV